MIFALGESIEFPNPELADESGILAVGGDLSVERMKEAYLNGIFPWYNEDDPIIWHSPDPRMVLLPEDLRVTKSMKQVLRSNRFDIRYNTAFSEVLYRCSSVLRNGQAGTWLNKDLRAAFEQMHALGHAISVESWRDGELVGGLYGVVFGRFFTGESMFALESNASKAAFITLVQSNQFDLIDCQTYTDHLASLGAEMIPRADFLRAMKSLIKS